MRTDTPQTIAKVIIELCRQSLRKQSVSHFVKGNVQPLRILPPSSSLSSFYMISIPVLCAILLPELLALTCAPETTRAEFTYSGTTITVTNNLSDKVYGLTSDPTGRLILAGTKSHSSTGEDIIFSNYYQGGSQAWSTEITSSSSDRAMSTAASPSGDVYVVGFYSATAYFAPPTGTSQSTHGGADIFVAKWSQAGVHQWTKTLGTTGDDKAYGVATDTSGNVYVVGAFSGKVDFDPGTSTRYFTSQGLHDVFITKLSSAGVYTWTVTLGSTGEDQANAIVIDTLGQIYIVGSFQGSVNFNGAGGSDVRSSNGGTDAFISSYTTSGGYRWTKTFGGTGTEEALAITLGNSGAIHIAGIFDSSVDFDPTNSSEVHTSNGLADSFLSSFSSDGTYRWSNTWGGAQADYANGVAVDIQGNIRVVGSFLGTSDFDPTDASDTKTSQGNEDAYIATYTEAGTFLDTTTIGGTGSDAALAITYSLASRSFFIGGYFSGNIDMNPDLGVDTKSSMGAEDGFVSGYIEHTGVAWAGNINSGLQTTIPQDPITMDSTGNVYIFSSFTGAVDFDITSGTDSLSSGAKQYAHLSKYQPDGSYAWTKTIGSASGNAYGFSAASDMSTGIFATGYFNSTVDFDLSGAHDIKVASGAENAAFVTKRGTDGSYNWTHVIDLSSHVYAYSVTSDPNGNAIVVGTFGGTGDFNDGAGTDTHSSLGAMDVFVAKYDANGTFQWAKTFGGTGQDQAYNVATDADGNIFVIGTYTGTVDFDPGTGTTNLTSKGGYDGFIIKLDTAGNFTWVRSIGGIYSDYLYGLTIDSLGDVYIAGSFLGTVDFNPSASVDNRTSTNTTTENGMIVKFTSAGDYRWVRTTTLGTYGQTFYSLAINSSNEVYATGVMSTEKVDFDESSRSDIRDSTTGELFIMQYSATGLYLGTRNFGPSSSSRHISIAADPNDDFAIFGYSGTADYDPSWSTKTLTMNSSGEFIARYQGDAPRSYTISGTTKESGSALSGVTINGGALTNKTTDVSGSFAYTGLEAGILYQLVPSLHGYTFSPSSYSGTLLSNVTITFAATKIDSDLDGLADLDEEARGTNPHLPDTDADGVKDGAEVTDGTNPLVSDTDGDGLSDGLEKSLKTNPKITDTDGDGLSDGQEIALGIDPKDADTDNDNLKDGEEITSDTDPSDPDTDDDGLTDGYEIAHSSNPLDANGDSDHDGISDSLEVINGTSINNPDTDSDGLRDGVEYRLGTNPLKSDTDGDGLLDGEEVLFGSNPLIADADNDGLNDKQERVLGTNPNDPDTDDDGIPDGEEDPTSATDPDTDHDGVLDVAEILLGTNPLSTDSDGDGLDDSREIDIGTDPKVADSDGDGISDGGEIAIQSNPLSTDSDGDGTTDLSETLDGTNPQDGNIDRDLDTVTNDQEDSDLTNPDNFDTDGDGLWDGAEKQYGTNPLGTDTDGDNLSDSKEIKSGTNPLVADTDGDGLNDDYELTLHTNPRKTDSDSDGLTDAEEVTLGTNPNLSDTDNDGRTDKEEIESGTDPLSPDSDDDSILDGAEHEAGTNSTDRDNDGISDDQEAIDGTNAYDRGSMLPVLGTTLCSEWNGFLGGMWNIEEHVNLSATKRNIRAKLYSLGGVEQGTRNITVQPGAQTDLLVHGMTGWQLESYGKVCSEVVGGNPGDIDGRMVYYKTNTSGSYDFAFAMPFLNGLIGNQYVPFNTYQPSYDPADLQNWLANWIQITNLETSKQSGTLLFYGIDGSKLGEQSVTLNGGARQDYSGHRFGMDKVGIVEWRPAKKTSKFQLRNVRYFYDNPSGIDSFDAAFQLEGGIGNGEELVVPLDTRGSTAVLEISNTLATEIKVVVIIYDLTGATKETQTVKLKGHASVHIITDTILSGKQGIATIKASASTSVIATAMQYGRNSSLGIQTLYGIQARQALGTVLRGSYNTFLSQDCRLLIANPTSSKQTATISLTRYTGLEIIKGEQVTVPAHGLYDYALCSKEEADNYGVVTVQPTNKNTIFANIVRLGNDDAYRFPTPVRQ